MILMGKEIGWRRPPFYVAELSQNYRDLKEAYALMKACKEAGADAVKIQALDPNELASKSSSIYHLYTNNISSVPELFDYGRDLDIPVFASVFGLRSLDILDALDCPAYKIASFENNWPELIEACRGTEKPLLISTGMEGLPDLQSELAQIDTVYMHCVSAYPCPLENAALNKLRYLGEMVHYYGYSDHTMGCRAAEYAVALGAQIIEKHVCLNDAAIDGHFAARPYQFRTMVENCNEAWEAVYHGVGNVEEAMKQYKRKDVGGVILRG